MVNFNVVLVLVGIASTLAAEYKLQYINEDSANQFEVFIKTYDKKYEHELEKAMRFGIFLRNLEEIAYQNEKNEGFVYGISQFSDLTHEEFKQYHTGFKADHDPYSNCAEITHSEDIEVESEFDWRQKGMVTRVKNQGNCGSCWAFSTIGNVESAYAIKTGNLQELSEQQLVDCDKSSSGCIEGLPKKALWYLKEQGSMSESSYPYTANAGNCMYDPNAVEVKVQGCALINVNEDQLSQKLQEMGPLSIAIDSKPIRLNYIGGVIQGATCVGGQQDHAVLLVGHGIDSVSNKPYWLIKNSWGETWGEQGYFRMERGVNCLNIMEGDNIVTAVL